MRAVLDTNVVLSGFLWGGKPHALLEEVRRGRLTLLISSDLLAELQVAVNRPKFRGALALADISPVWLMSELRFLVVLVEPSPLDQPVCRDPDDDAVLALAIAGEAEIIVSGDADLLVLGSYAGIPIVTPAQALAIIGPEPP